MAAQQNLGHSRRRGLAPWLGLGLVLVARRRRHAPIIERSTHPQSAEPERSFAPPPISARAPQPTTDAPADSEAERGRRADKPSEIPAKGWKDILWRTVKEYGDDDVASWARSIAFSGILALFPALAAFVAIYGLFADIETARSHLAGLTGVIPADAATFIGDQMVRIAAANDAGLGLTFLIGVLLSLWSANSGMKALFKGLNIAYDEEEKRGFIKLNLVTLAFTLGGILFVALAMGAIVVVPVALEALGLGGGAQALALLRWPILLALVVGGLALLYRYGPSRDEPKWRWVTWGSVAATVMWIVGSLLFSWYLGNFADYNKTYGSLGAVFGFLMWLWLSAVVVLFGGELNAEIEHQTAKDSTEGPAKPMGARGAEMADTVGEAKEGSLLPEAIAKRLRH
ncbi:YihY/virulence factor BrkB family protein [Phenylobacterium sp.]|uniref:YihY/virulence factor BrkB family protein n=1 Tax=Phenylobacterium sp. TaxID=1871053 RepID=UPI002E34AA83|nr:YihY/virulence factor BrkB family protein [Phenylobacterium sp.]HEX2562128.1 YihY/virulence factor BrkB family protein [Phenylobacterium sp.]